MTTNFDIYSIINKADGKDRAIIFFDELLNMSIYNKSKFSDAEMESLSNSFKSNVDIDLFNNLQHNSLYCLLTIAQVEKEILRAEYLTTYLRFYNSSQNDKCFIDYLFSETSKDLQKNKIASDKKHIKKVFKELLEQTNKMCFLSFSDDFIKKFIDKANNNKNSEDLEEQDSNYYQEEFAKFLIKAIAAKTKLAQNFLDQLKSKCAEFEFKFEVVESKIKDLETELEKYKLITKKILEADE
ncbi:MAG: hypothetical protein KGQ36_04190 [Rickettsiales bacterium]|nr:hypothetical protein [Rickettsiales bacterium]